MQSSSQINGALLLAFVALVASDCGGGGGGKECKLNGGTVLAHPADDATGSDWPRFHRDRANTGRTEVSLRTTAPDAPRRIFPPVGTTIGAISTTPILGPNGRVFFGSQDGTVYAINRQGDPLFFDDQGEPEHLVRAAAVSATPLLGDNGAIFVAGGDGSVLQYSVDGILLQSTLLGGFISGSPNIGNDGTIYVGSLSGSFGSVCPNGATRFLVAFAPIQTTPAVMNDPEDVEDLIIINAEESAQVRGFDLRGRQRWSFFPSAAPRGAVVLDEDSGNFFIADASGRVSSASALDGRRQGLCSEDPSKACSMDTDCSGTCVPFAFRAARCAPSASDTVCTTNSDCESPAVCVADAATTAPALGLETLYVTSESGTVYALDSRTAALRWMVPVGATVHSSPAVAVDATSETVVFGADDGMLYAVRDGQIIWSVALGSPIGTSSPAIAADGTIFVGTADGVLYAVDAAA